MSAPSPILDGHELTEEQQRLLALVDELRKEQLTFMDEAGRRIIELCTGLIGVLFAVQPRRYDDFPNNLTHLGEELKKMMDHKAHWVQVAGGLFYAGCLALALLVVTIILF